jgi:hypothetical protein
MNQVFGSVTGKELLRLFLISAATIAIFVGDVVTDLEIAVSVLYVAVVLMSALFYERRGCESARGSNRCSDRQQGSEENYERPVGVGSRSAPTETPPRRRFHYPTQ